jgi:uncharacterized protein
MIVDAHAHVGRFNAWPLAASEPEALVEILRKEGIDYAMTSSAKAICYDCSAGNTELLEIAQQHKEILPFLCVDPRRHEEAFAELDTCRARGFCGVKLHPAAHQYSLTSPSAASVLNFCQENTIAVLTHSDEENSGCGPEAIRHAAERHPRLQLIVGHACLFSSRDVVDVAEEHPNVYLEISVNYEAGKLEDTIERLGSDRVLFGSDVPLHNPSVMLQRLKLIGLPAKEEAMILSGNAQRVFGLNI